MHSGWVKKIMRMDGGVKGCGRNESEKWYRHLCNVLFRTAVIVMVRLLLDEVVVVVLC